MGKILFAYLRCSLGWVRVLGYIRCGEYIRGPAET
jgi:hypothetical protein